MSRSRALRYYILSRLLMAPLMIWIITTLVFLLLRATPGDPVDVVLGGRAPEEAKAAMRERLGLNLPLWVQYLHYLGDLMRFDLGTSLTSQGQSVWTIIQLHFPATVELTILSMIVSVGVGVAIGSLSVINQATVQLGCKRFAIDPSIGNKHVLKRLHSA